MDCESGGRFIIEKINYGKYERIECSTEIDDLKLKLKIVGC